MLRFANCTPGYHECQICVSATKFGFNLSAFLAKFRISSLIDSTAILFSSFTPPPHMKSLALSPANWWEVNERYIQRCKQKHQTNFTR